MAELRRCTRCMIPETHETLMFDEQGVCTVCRAQEYKKTQIDWVAREQEFRELVESYRGKHAYDCIIPFSGGKDSTYTLWHMVRTYQVKPLVVQFDHGFMRPRLLENNVRTLKRLGVDYLSFRPNWRVVRALMLESLKRKGDFCWHCHTGVFSYPMHLAVRFDVPLVVWGEPSAEYTTYYGYDEKEEVDERRFNRATNLGITADDMLGMIEGEDPRDLAPFRYPPLKDLRRLGVRSVCLGTYHPWDVKTQAATIERELGWQGNDVEGVPPGYVYEKIECWFQGVRDYIRFLKRGYGRTAHLTSIDIRNSRMSREDAETLVREHDGKRPASVDLFLEAVGIDEEEFIDIVMAHVVSPWKPDVTGILHARPLHDHDRWDRTIPLTEVP